MGNSTCCPCTDGNTSCLAPTDGKCMTCTEGVRVVGEESCTHVGDTGLSDIAVAMYEVKLGHAWAWSLYSSSLHEHLITLFLEQPHPNVFE